MEKLFQFTLALIILCILPFSSGLECFQCASGFPNVGGFPLPISSKCEKKVPDEYKKTCETTNILGPYTKNGNVTIAQDEELTCAKGSGKLGDTTYVVRGCLPKVLISAVDSTLLGSCNSNNLKQWAEKFNLTIDLNPDEAAKVSVDLCFCDGNGCNSALVGSRPSNWLYIFALISAVLLAFNVKV